MSPFLYTCPTTGFRVQGWIDSDEAEWADDRYEAVTCLACRGTHPVNPKTGKRAGESERTF
jgi:hypothetical protein